VDVGVAAKMLLKLILNWNVSMWLRMGTRDGYLARAFVIHDN
jgi:hypothetical protein